MSRIGKQPITVPAGVEVKIGTDVVEVKGPKGTLHTPVCSLLNYDLTDGVLTLTRVEDDRHSRAQHGLRRTLLANCIEGVTKGFSKSLEVIGVGYRVAVKGNLVELSVGFSHPPDPRRHRSADRSDPDHQRRRQGTGGRNGRQDPSHPQARTLQGQGYQVYHRDHPPQGR